MSSIKLLSVPQGSVLGPLLFIFYINDIVSIDPVFSSNLFLYADDMLLLMPLNSIDSINSKLSSISQWLMSRSLSINTQKSKYMIFSLRPQSYFDSLPPVQIASFCLDRVYSYKYLGLTFRPNLSWSTHIFNMKKKAKKHLGLIYRHFYLHCPPSILLGLYNSLVRPILEYGAVVWDPSSQSLTSSIESVQHFALKLSFKSWNSSYQSLLDKSCLPSLAQRRKASKILNIFKFKSNLSHSFASPLKSPPSPPYFSRNYNKDNFIPIFCKSTSFSNSFFPSSIKLWNSLPSSFKSATSITSLKSMLKYYYF